MKFEILTLFPEMFTAITSSSIIGRACESGKAEIRIRNIRDFTSDKHHVADDTPYGGGPGMVMKPEPIAAALETIIGENSARPLTRVYLSPQGEPWSQQLAAEFSTLPGVILLCGHYEGVDERIRQTCIDREISIGDYVLTGGEIPAMVVLDSIIRLLPGVLGNSESAKQESFAANGILDHPHYTRPEDFRGMKVPEILLSGHHKKIEQWRRNKAIEQTLSRRPDLLETHRHTLSCEEKQLIESLMNEP